MLKQPLKRTTKNLLTQLQLRSDLEEDDDCANEDLDLHVAYRRPVLINDLRWIEDDAQELDESILWRLFLARQMALLSIRR